MSGSSDQAQEAKARFGAIHRLLRELRGCQAGQEEVSIEVEKSTAVSRGGCYCFARGATVDRFSNTPAAEGLRTLELGRGFRFLVKSPIDGHLQVFNLGTDGSCARIVPRPEEPLALLQANGEFSIPQALPSDGDIRCYRVDPPPSSLHGEPERLLAIVTRQPRPLTLGDLSPDLVQRETCLARGFSGKGRQLTSVLSGMPPHEWRLGLLEMTVVPGT